MVEIALRHELDDVAKKSLDEIVLKKEIEQRKPIDNEEYTSRYLHTRTSCTLSCFEIC